MKPHILFYGQLWHCHTRCGGRIGVGWTPSEAYKDWLRVNTRRHRAGT